MFYFIFRNLSQASRWHIHGKAKIFQGWQECLPLHDWQWGFKVQPDGQADKHALALGHGAHRTAEQQLDGLLRSNLERQLLLDDHHPATPRK